MKVLTSQAGAKTIGETAMPTELVMLHRIGISHDLLEDAWKCAQLQNCDPVNILIARNIITHDVWSKVQILLANERRIAYLKRKRKTFLLDQAIHNLSSNLPRYSAKATFTSEQVWRYVCYILMFMAALFTYYHITLAVFFHAMICFYAAVIIMRLMILAEYQTPISTGSSLETLSNDTLPIYSILVPLYGEQSQVRDLASHLYQLDWPKEKLDIKLVCEEDDPDTIAEILRFKLPDCFQLVTVPPAEPRTKPKALNFALPMIKGEFTVLYDAEDRPAPGQLREAYAKFMQSEENLACVQAPLRIHNANQNWLTKLFAIEYFTLFSGILPALAKWQVPLPLGGTSNHFKTSVLKDIGGWDPYNVTEDADLGIRLFREGYLASTIETPTFEEAPPKLTVWRKQRTRWIKGWMQTLLVHNRNPLLFAGETGLRNTIAFHLVLTSVVVSVLFHPLLIVYFFWKITALPGSFQSGLDTALVVASGFNLAGGYTTYGLLALVVLKSAGENRLCIFILHLPFYWLLASYAGWHAVVELLRKPHYWAKTPHGLSSTGFHVTKY